MKLANKRKPVYSEEDLKLFLFVKGQRSLRHYRIEERGETLSLIYLDDDQNEIFFLHEFDGIEKFAIKYLMKLGLQPVKIA